jgi:2-haloacid dehalogenase
MAGLRVKGIVFDMYGTLVDVGAVAEACKQVAPEPGAFNSHWRAKQLEHAFLRTLMGKYRDFWKVTEEALEFVIQHFGLQVSPERRKQVMEAWLHPTPYPEVQAALPKLKEKYVLAILSNGNSKMLQKGLEGAGLRPYFRWVMRGRREALQAFARNLSACAQADAATEKRDPLCVIELLRCDGVQKFRLQGLLDQ